MSTPLYQLHHRDFDYVPVPDFTMLVFHPGATTIEQAPHLRMLVPGYMAAAGVSRAVFDGAGWCVASMNDAGQHMITAAWVNALGEAAEAGGGEWDALFLLDLDITFRHMVEISR